MWLEVDLATEAGRRENYTVLIEISSLAEHRQDLADYTDLKDVKLRSRLDVERGLYLAESNQVIKRALEAGHQPRSLLLSPRWLEDLAPALQDCAATQGQADGGPVPIYLASEELLQQLVGFHLHRGAISAMQRPQLPTVEELLARPGIERVLVLENLVDHTNVGAAFRSAAGCGYDAVIVTPSCADPLYRRAVRVSMGTVFQIPWTRAELWPDSARFHEAGFELAALALSDNSTPLQDFARALEAQPQRKIALVAGTEGDGLRRSTLAQVDHVVRIEMKHGVDSLNVAAACAVACWATRPLRGD